MKTRLNMRAVMVFAMMVFGNLLPDSTRVQCAPIPDTMVRIPAGEFTMGDTYGEYSRGGPLILDEFYNTRTHFVSSFWIDKTEVTYALWNEVYDWAVNHGYYFDHGAWGKELDHPAHSVTWYDAILWCNARSEKEGRTPTYYIWDGYDQEWVVHRYGHYIPMVRWNYGYRLPTEAEWEKAARGGFESNRFVWPDANTITHERANYYSTNTAPLGCDISATSGYHPDYAVGDEPYTSPVGSFPPNGYELYDMAGNVAEWCWDGYSTFNYGAPRVDPKGSSSHSYCVLRGGSWNHGAWGLRAAAKNSLRPEYWNPPDNNVIGLRTVISYLPDWTQTNQSQPVYTFPPSQEPEKNSLIVVTHGRIEKEDGQIEPPNPDWVDEMTNAITAYLSAEGLNNWQVVAYKWPEKAWTTRLDILLGKLTKNAVSEGGKLGRCLTNDNWSHIHFIAHSAGSALIQTATDVIKDPTSESSDTVIHETFLDAYVGFKYNGADRYGKLADWSDSYIARDVSPRTESTLENSLNVDVTFLDPIKRGKGIYRSSADGEISVCYETITSHGWPHLFYTVTVPPSDFEESEGFGFPLSKEGGNWDFALFRYGSHKGETPIILGTPDPECVDIRPTPINRYSILDLTAVPTMESNTGRLEIQGSGLTLGTSWAPSSGEFLLNSVASSPRTEPAWIIASVEITNAVNFITLEAQFTSTNGAEG
ncbi:MAG: hypothetical protein A3H68_01620, partial [Candidatus Taylorbacteria bacterium RIFCSPLOWO2_02_FULL_46_40]